MARGAVTCIQVVIDGQTRKLKWYAGATADELARSVRTLANVADNEAFELTDDIGGEAVPLGLQPLCWATCVAPVPAAAHPSLVDALQRRLCC